MTGGFGSDFADGHADDDVVELYNYQLPQDLIAQTPAEPRDSSRLLVFSAADNSVIHSQFANLADFLRPGDCLIANDSRVIPARLHGVKTQTGGKVEILLLSHRVEYGPTAWEALVKPGSGSYQGAEYTFAGGLTAQVLAEAPSGGRILALRAQGSEDPAAVERAITLCGETPLPPYIHETLQNPERYQTVYARLQGSAAAPTAGLHFTEPLIADLRRKGIQFGFVTLHVGLDTFRPVSEARLSEHVIHSEYAVVPQETADLIQQTKANRGRVIAVGTTSVRALESAAQECGDVRQFAGYTRLFITPGYIYKAIDGVITNFHLPKSTLLAMISAYVGREKLLELYTIAIQNRYRFYSFGDAALLISPR